MENKNNQCSKCKFFDRYYTKEIKQFKRTKCGWCYKKADSVCVNDCCENFTYGCKPRRRTKFINYYLNDLLTQLSAIRAIIEADCNESEDEHM